MWSGQLAIDWIGVRYQFKLFQVRSLHLSDMNELVCMAVDFERNLFAIGKISLQQRNTIETFAIACFSGSQLVALLIDPRIPCAIKSIPSNDTDQGIRSVSFLENYLGIGGGMGRLSIYDLRAGRYLPQHGRKRYQWFATDCGWLERDNTFLTYFNDQEIPHAIYTHSFSPMATYLFIGGGPLMVRNALASLVYLR